MKISCNEGILTALSSRGCFIKEGRLNYRKETKKNFKERWFKLRANLLFYYKTNDFGIICEDEPRGCLILTRYTITEEIVPNAFFAFSITFHGLDEKHYFAGQSTDHCKEWINVLRSADMDLLRQQLLYLKMQLQQKNPTLHRSNGAALFKKANKAANNVPKRFEKKIGDDKKMDLLKQPSAASHIPKVKSSSALEQVRKSYSLASLMLDPLTGNARAEVSSVNKSTFFVDRKHYLINMEASDDLCRSLDAYTSSRKSSLDSVHQHSNFFSEFSCSPVASPFSDPDDKSENLSNANLLRDKSSKHHDDHMRQHRQFKAKDIQLQMQTRRSSIVLQPLALVSNPFASSFVKPIGSHGKFEASSAKQESEDSVKDHHAPQSMKVNGIFQRPRSCTLAQLESIPTHLLIKRNEVVFRIGDDVDVGSMQEETKMSKSNVSAGSDRRGLQNWETFDN